MLAVILYMASHSCDKMDFFSSLLQLKFNVFFTHNAEYTFHHLGYQLLLLACCYAPDQGALSDDAVWRLSRFIRSAGGVCGRPAGWRVLADQARLGRHGSRLPLRASVAGRGGAYRGGRTPTACLALPRSLEAAVGVYFTRAFHFVSG